MIICKSILRKFAFSFDSVHTKLLRQAFFKMAEAARNRLPFGHDEEFVNEVDDDFICLICQFALKEPILTTCGHRFCRDCLGEYLRR